MQNNQWIGVILRANRDIGTGHLMRVRSVLPYLHQHAKLRLYAYAFDPSLYQVCNDYDEIKVFATKEEILEHIANSTKLPSVFIIDDYAIDASFEEQLFDRGSKLFVVDDLADRKHKCHYLLDQRLIYQDNPYQGLLNPECKLLIGSKYSLTSPRFYPQNYHSNYQSKCTCGGHHLPLNYRAQHGKSTCIAQDAAAQPLPRIFISFGGADPVSACLRLTKTILNAKLYEQYFFTLVAGASNSDYEEICNLVHQEQVQYPKAQNFTVIKHCNDIADLLFKHDVAVGAFGGMTRERIACGIPTIGVEIADNQRGGYELVESFKLGVNLVLDDLSDSAKVKEALGDTVTNGQEYSQNCFKVYDGHGLERIVDCIVSLLPPQG